MKILILDKADEKFSKGINNFKKFKDILYYLMCSIKFDIS